MGLILHFVSGAIFITCLILINAIMTRKNVEESRKESIILSIIVLLVGLLGIIMSFDLYLNILPEAISLSVGMSCILLIGGGIFVFLAYFKKWTLKQKPLKQKRNLFITNLAIAIGFTIMISLLYSYYFSSSPSTYGLIVVWYFYPALNWGFAGFYAWSYLKEKNFMKTSN